MGMRFVFTCNSCNYKAEVSGKQDYGNSSITQTFVCKICNSLHDSAVVIWGAMAGGAKRKVVEPECTKCHSHELSQWWAPSNCPHCKNGEMQKGELAEMWD